MTLKPLKSEIFTASGGHIHVKGKFSVMVDVDGIQCLTEMAIGDRDVDAILGFALLKANNCQLNMNAKILLIRCKPCKLNVDGTIGCYRITVTDKVEITSRSEVII